MEYPEHKHLLVGEMESLLLDVFIYCCVLGVMERVHSVCLP